MTWLLLEAGLALALLIGIVVWTLPAKRDPGKKPEGEDPPPGQG